jgi:hypothetical protein
MSDLEHWLPSQVPMTGTFGLLLWAVGVVTALVFVVSFLVFRDFGARSAIDIFLRTAVVVIGAVLAWGWLDYSILRERAAERRALDARAAELTARAIAPGSALACLDAVGHAAVETACEKALFASPQAVAAAIAYVDARLTLLADGFSFAARDQSYAVTLEAPRRALEADRFGVVAHVLAGRGCSADDCAAFDLMRDAERVRANLKERSFEVHVTRHAANWPSDSAIAAAPASAPAVTSALPAIGAPVGSKYSFPSASSIPPISIMNAEPTDAATPKAQSEPTAAPPPARR